MRNQLKIAIPLALISFLTGVVVWAFYVKDRNLIEYKEPTLSLEQKANLEQELNNLLVDFDKLGEKNYNDEQRYNLYVRLGSTYRRLGRLEEARKVLLKAVNIRETEATVWSELFAVYLDMNDINKAKALGEKVITMRPTDSQNWALYIGMHSNFLGTSAEEIEKFYERAFFSTNFGVEILESYARYKESKNDLVTALNYWRLVLEKNPDNDTYKSETARLEAKVLEINRGG